MRVLHLLILAVSLGVAGHICAKLASAGLSGDAPMMDKLKNPLLFGAVSCFGLGFAVYMYSLSRFELSYAQPIFSSSIIATVTLVSIIWLKESADWQKIVGIVLIIAGVIVLGLSEGKVSGAARGEPAPHSAVGQDMNPAGDADVDVQGGAPGTGDAN